MSLDTLITIIAIFLKPLSWLLKKGKAFYWGKLKKHPFIFDKYTKRVTIYKNGHGLICHYLNIDILDLNRFHSFRRWIDIRDACKNTNFDKFENMQTRDASERMNSFGFWYEPHDLISGIKPTINEGSKTLEWEFLFDAVKLKRDKVKSMRLSYSISVPCLFPITDGKFDSSKAPTSDYIFVSGLTVKHRIREMNYIISLEKGIEIQKHPILKIFPLGIDYSPSREISLDDESDLFYNRYTGKIKRPGFGATIKDEWQIGETK